MKKLLLILLFCTSLFSDVFFYNVISSNNKNNLSYQFDISKISVSNSSTIFRNSSLPFFFNTTSYQSSFFSSSDRYYTSVSSDFDNFFKKNNDAFVMMYETQVSDLYYKFTLFSVCNQSKDPNFTSFVPFAFQYELLQYTVFYNGSTTRHFLTLNDVGGSNSNFVFNGFKDYTVYCTGFPGSFSNLKSFSILKEDFQSSNIFNFLYEGFFPPGSGTSYNNYSNFRFLCEENILDCDIKPVFEEEECKNSVYGSHPNNFSVSSHLFNVVENTSSCDQFLYDEFTYLDKTYINLKFDTVDVPEFKCKACLFSDESSYMKLKDFCSLYKEQKQKDCTFINKTISDFICENDQYISHKCISIDSKFTPESLSIEDGEVYFTDSDGIKEKMNVDPDGKIYDKDGNFTGYWVKDGQIKKYDPALETIKEIQELADDAQDSIIDEIAEENPLMAQMLYIVTSGYRYIKEFYSYEKNMEYYEYLDPNSAKFNYTVMIYGKEYSLFSSQYFEDHAPYFVSTFRNLLLFICYFLVILYIFKRNI
jgi:hypothetical protein